MKVNKEELNKKNTWIVTDLCHGGYTFNLETTIYKDTTILDILDELAYWGLENRIEKYENSNVYILDEVYHEDAESDTWCLTEQEKKRFLPLHIEAIMIMPLNEFLKGGGFLTASFGSTHRKYGVMDYVKYPVEMEKEKDKNEIQIN